MAAAITSICLPATSRADDITAGTGNELVNYCNDSNHQASNDLWFGCVNFVYGVKVGFYFGLAYTTRLNHPDVSAKQLSKDINIGLMFCMPDATVTREQQALVVSKYLHDHPETLNNINYVEVLNAFKAAWPCPKSGN